MTLCFPNCSVFGSETSSSSTEPSSTVSLGVDSSSAWTKTSRWDTQVVNHIWFVLSPRFCSHIFITIVRVIPEWIRGNAADPAGPWGPTQRGPFYDLGWRNGSRPSLLLDHKAHPGHRPPSQAGPFLLRPERDYRTEHLEACGGKRRGWWSVFFLFVLFTLH